MVKRVKRVKRKRKRVKIGKSKATSDVAAAGGVHKKISAKEGDGRGNFTRKSINKAKRKQGSGGVDGVDDEGQDVAVATDNAVSRKGDGGMDSDGFGSSAEDKGREAYEQFLKGHVEADAERFEAMRSAGQQDSFDPEAAPASIEDKGQIGAANHMVRMYDHWTLNSLDRTQAMEEASKFLSGFHRPDSVKKVITELESKPIRDLHPYPLEVMMHMLDTNPRKLPGVRYGGVFDQEVKGHVGYPIEVKVPQNMDGSPQRIKAIAYLGSEGDLDENFQLKDKKSPGPGYGIYPHPKKPDAYNIEVDSPGRYCFAALSVNTQNLGKITKELQGGTIGRFWVNVEPMGKKS
jgi:hypothetical protein